MKRCKIDEENRRIWRELYQIEDDGCIKLKAVIGFDPSKCPRREQCKKLNEELRVVHRKKGAKN